MTKGEIFSSFNSRKSYLEKIISHCRKSLKGAPDGSLIVSRSGNSIQYYLYLPGQKRKYIKDQALAQALARKSYLEKVLKQAVEELNYINGIVEFYPGISVEEVYNNIPPMKRPLIRPVYVDDETYAEWWLSQEYKSLNVACTEEYSTNANENFRSKSEAMIAALLREYKVPFRYECQLHLKDFGNVYPDFTVLNKRTRQIYYHEHFGLMENTEYAIKAIRKINAYERNGYIQGKNFIATYESEHVHLDMKVIEIIVKECYI